MLSETTGDDDFRKASWPVSARANSSHPGQETGFGSFRQLILVNRPGLIIGARRRPVGHDLRVRTIPLAALPGSRPAGGRRDCHPHHFGSHIWPEARSFQPGATRAPERWSGIAQPAGIYLAPRRDFSRKNGQIKSLLART